MTRLFKQGHFPNFPRLKAPHRRLEAFEAGVWGQRPQLRTVPCPARCRRWHRLAFSLLRRVPRIHPAWDSFHPGRLCRIRAAAHVG